MNEHRAKKVVQMFAILSAILVSVSSFIKIPMLTPTFFAGGTLVAIYMAANPRLLVGSRTEWREIYQNGPVIPIALHLGSLLMFLGLIEAGVRASAT